MNHYPYLIIGGGLTGAAAIRGIRRADAEGRIREFGAQSGDMHLNGIGRQVPVPSRQCLKQTVLADHLG